jgi:AraC family transcriptional regulator of adaptative response / methylphosphotriester-DNA alkyltransferase methyltransferase
MTGFKSLSNFYKRFKEQTGHTPSEYRKSRGDL